MIRDDIIRMAREAGMPPVEIISDKPVLYPVPDAIERFYHLAHAAGEQAERERTKRLVEDMQNELRQRRMTGKDT